MYITCTLRQSNNIRKYSIFKLVYASLSFSLNCRVLLCAVKLKDKKIIVCVKQKLYTFLNYYYIRSCNSFFASQEYFSEVKHIKSINDMGHFGFSIMLFRSTVYMHVSIFYMNYKKYYYKNSIVQLQCQLYIVIMTSCSFSATVAS